MNLLTLLLAINLSMQALFIPGTPFYINGTGTCYYPTSGIDNEQLFNNTKLGLNSSNIGDEAQYPTNTTYNGSTIGDGNIFNSIFDSGEQLLKYGEMMRGLVLGGFIEGVIDNVVLNCYFDEDGNLTQGQDHAFWTTFKTGMNLIFLFLIILTVWYWISGRSHIISS